MSGPTFPDNEILAPCPRCGALKPVKAKVCAHCGKGAHGCLSTFGFALLCVFGFIVAFIVTAIVLLPE